MYAASDATTESARVFFISYMFTVNLLITQLIVGVILDTFSDIREMNSKYMYPLLYACCGDVSDEERETLKDRVVALSIELVPIHQTLAILASAKHPRDSIAVAEKRALSLSIFLGKIEREKRNETDLERALRKAPIPVLVEVLLKKIDSRVLLHKHEWLLTVVPDGLSVDIQITDKADLMEPDSNDKTDSIEWFESDSDEDVPESPRSDLPRSPRSVRRKAADTMARMDADGDGQVCKEEFVASGGTVEEFERFDRNGDGMLHREEIQEMVSAEQEQVQVNALFPYQIALGAFIAITLACLVNIILLFMFLETSFGISNNDKMLIACQAQSHSQISVSWLVEDHQGAVERAAGLIDQSAVTVSFSTTQLY
jgi:hypothetical protein